ncbi:MAG: pentapeptide repeat-containing protein, partial [Candidatus Poribacteria bacterium]
MENGPEPFQRIGTSDQHLEVNADDVLNAIAEGRDIKIKYCDIKGDLDISKIYDRFDKDDGNRSIIKGSVIVSLSTINGHAFFFSASFSKVADFSSTSFSEFADFNSASFKGDAYFSSTNFDGKIYFFSTIFGNTVDLDEAHFGDKVTPSSFDDLGMAYRKSSLSGGYFFEKAGECYWKKKNNSSASDSFRNARVEYEKEGK